MFTLKPLEFGKPNTLVCFVSNLFPPTLTVNWRHHLDPVEGIGPTFVSAVDELSFQAFSYLNFTPAPSDLFSCIVTHKIDNHTAVAYWGENFLLGSLVPCGGKKGWTRGRAFFLCLDLVEVHSHPEQLQFFMPQFLLFHPKHPCNSPGRGAYRPSFQADLFPFFSSAP